MPAPKLIADAERDVQRAMLAARNLGADATHGLDQAQAILSEARFFAYGVADSKGYQLNEYASRLVSAILGFEVTITGFRAGLNELEAYNRLAR